MILTVTQKIKCIKETKVSFLLYMYVKCFFFLNFMECGTPFTKNLKNYALWIFFPICVTFGIKSKHFVKKTQTFFQIELWLALMLTNSCIKKSALPNTPHLPFVVNHDKIFLVVCYGYFTWRWFFIILYRG